MRPRRDCAEGVLSVARLLCVLGVLGLVRVPLVAAQRCSREPESPYGRPPPAKTPGSGGYRVEVSGNHTKYEPGQRYEVKLVSIQKQYVSKFKGYFLTVETAVPAEYGMSQHVGHFLPFSSSAIRFSDECGPNTVTHTSDSLKSYVSLMWAAPPPGSGCVVFRATVIEGRGTWFKDDDALSYELCERVRENQDEQPPPLRTCCACDEAKYEVTFEGLWSRNTHPRDFPIDRTAAAFSDIIGASHADGFRFWEYDGHASEGVRQVAEWGDTKKLENELKAHSSQIRTIIKARGLEYPNLQGRTFAVFRVDREHHQASLMSRLRPSPDWVVGVSAMELCLRNCSWAERQVLNLRPWDVGTKNGDSYLGSYPPTNPRQKIQRITSKWPADSPFYDPTGGEIPPLARLVIQRQRVYERGCPDGGPGRAGSSDQACATTRWGDWSACSVSCGQGHRRRHRIYRDTMQARIASCRVPLEESGLCSAAILCDGSGDGRATVLNGYGVSSGSADCALSEWSRWTSCSTTCGPGTRSRQRSYKSRQGYKRCREQTHELQDCTVKNQPCLEREQMPAGCEVTPWSTWSPCSITCGEGGTLVRTRMFLSQGEQQSARCADVRLKDQTSCRPLRTDCQLAHSEAVAICKLPVDSGSCRNTFERWYYSEQQGRCVSFIYGGCRGNANNFNTPAECEETCEAVFDAERRGSEFGTTYTAPAGGGDGFRGGGYGRADGSYGSPQYAPTGGGGGAFGDLSRRPELLSSSQVINPLLASRSQLAECQVGPWGSWGPCSASCGSGTQVRRRRPQHPGRAGTAGCGRRRLEKHRQCRWQPRC